MKIKRTPWISTARVIQIKFDDYKIISWMRGKGIASTREKISLASIEYACIQANIIICNLIKESKNA